MITQAVFDTNVMVSGILFPASPPGKLIDALLEGWCCPVISDAILAEYAEVLNRPKFKIAPERIEIFIEAIQSIGICAPFALSQYRARFPDPDDVIFVEAALGSNCALVTGNKRHFPSALMQGVRVFSPADFLNQCLRI
jgi:putative PIN family toxin of toxin-antitoxin system